MTQEISHGAGMLAAAAIGTAKEEGGVTVHLNGVATPFTFARLDWHDKDATYLLHGIDEENLSVWFDANSIVAVRQRVDI